MPHAPSACRRAHAPDAIATRVLTPDELDVLRAAGRTRLPNIPSTRDVLLAVAALGGHIKWSGEPGRLTLSRGFTKLEYLTEGWRLARLPPDRDHG